MFKIEGAESENKLNCNHSKY